MMKKPSRLCRRKRSSSPRRASLPRVRDIFRAAEYNELGPSIITHSFPLSEKVHDDRRGVQIGASAVVICLFRWPLICKAVSSHPRRPSTLDSKLTSKTVNLVMRINTLKIPRLPKLVLRDFAVV